jgi:hypothetical protein
LNVGDRNLTEVDDAGDHEQQHRENEAEFDERLPLRFVLHNAVGSAHDLVFFFSDDGMAGGRRERN